jgi:CelD/BcsL family acetyltransferase involved in cellulose biosynthesis
VDDSLKVTVIPGEELDAGLVRVWRELQHANPILVSPFFSPEFTEAVAAARDDVEVALIEDGGEPAAFFPFQRSVGSRGIPVGGSLSDYQGLVCRPEFDFDPRELLRQCKLVAWDFDHLLASQEFLSPFHLELSKSPQMDLSQGYEAYASERRAAGSQQIKKCGNLRRRLEREVGQLRFVAHCAETAPLKQTLAWKSRQYVESGKRDLFALAWPHAVIRQIFAMQGDNFAGMLSLLYAGERLVAGHFGMRSRTVWHYWFPAYDPAMARYSPGLILLLKMAEHAPSLGLLTIDLGQGKTLYKDRLMNAAVPLASGTVELPSWLSLRRSVRRQLRTQVLRSPFADLALSAIRTLRRLRTRQSARKNDKP